MERNEALGLIVRATQWLTRSPLTHSGGGSGNRYVVEISAETPGANYMICGVCFRLRAIHVADGSVLDGGFLLLVDYADHESYWDHVPIARNPTAEDPRIGVNDQEGVDMLVMHSYTDNKLTRMAANAQRILEAYGQL